MPPKAASQSQAASAPTQPANAQAEVKPKRVRRTKKQIAEDKLAAEEAKNAMEQKRVSDLQQIAALENQMVDEDANDATPRPNAGQKLRPLHRTYAQLSFGADGEETGEETDQNPDAYETLTEPPTDHEEPPKKKAKKAPKPKARTEINAARKANSMDVDSEVEIVDSQVEIEENLVDKSHNRSATSKSKFVPFCSHSCHHVNTR